MAMRGRPDRKQKPTTSLRGVLVFKGFLDRSAQAGMLVELRARRCCRAASVAADTLWQADVRQDDLCGKVRMVLGPDWIPLRTQASVWCALASDPCQRSPGLGGGDRSWSRQPECCLLNFYGTGARMGMHRDCDEADFSYPVVSVSLGDDALFRIGNRTRGGRTESVWLSSGDVVVLGGAARLLYHGVDRVKPGTSTLLNEGGRINLTLRVVD